LNDSVKNPPVPQAGSHIFFGSLTIPFSLISPVIFLMDSFSSNSKLINGLIICLPVKNCPKELFVLLSANNSYTSPNRSIFEECNSGISFTIL